MQLRMICISNCILYTQQMDVLHIVVYWVKHCLVVQQGSVRRQYGPPRYWYLSTRLYHGVITAQDHGKILHRCQNSHLADENK
jgi:hypothetical protein